VDYAVPPRHRDIEDDHIGPGAGGEQRGRRKLDRPISHCDPNKQTLEGVQGFRRRVYIALWRQVRIVNDFLNSTLKWAIFRTKPAAEALK